MIDLHPDRKIGTVFRAWIESWGETEEDAREVRAFDADEAAMDMAEQVDSDAGDYPILRDSFIHVRVNGPDGSIKRFRVIGESLPHYTAVHLPEKAP